MYKTWSDPPFCLNKVIIKDRTTKPLQALRAFNLSKFKQCTLYNVPTIITLNFKGCIEGHLSSIKQTFSFLENNKIFNDPINLFFKCEISC